jgi:hypothetical protein
MSTTREQASQGVTNPASPRYILSMMNLNCDRNTADGGAKPGKFSQQNEELSEEVVVLVSFTRSEYR